MDYALYLVTNVFTDPVGGNIVFMHSRTNMPKGIPFAMAAHVCQLRCSFGVIILVQ